MSTRVAFILAAALLAAIFAGMIAVSQPAGHPGELGPWPTGDGDAVEVHP